MPKIFRADRRESALNDELLTGKSMRKDHGKWRGPNQAAQFSLAKLAKSIISLQEREKVRRKIYRSPHVAYAMVTRILSPVRFLKS
jgi:hypothetical protein